MTFMPDDLQSPPMTEEGVVEERAQVDAEGRLVISRAAREQYGLVPGASVPLEFERNGVYVDA